MRRLPLWALLPILMVLAACLGQTPTPAATPTSVAATAQPSSIIPSPTNIIPSPPPQGTPGTTTATATPTSASLQETSTPTLSQVQATVALTPTTMPTTSLAISVAPIPTDIVEYSRSHWKHWTDEDGDCQDARQEVLISESLVEVTFESERKCRVAMGRWYGAFTGINVEAPGDLDIDHLVPLKNAHDSGGWAWSSDSNCVESQEEVSANWGLKSCQGEPCLSMELRVTSSLRIQAVRASFFGFPAANRRW